MAPAPDRIPTVPPTLAAIFAADRFGDHLMVRAAIAEAPTPEQCRDAERAYREARDAERCACGHSRLSHHTYRREGERFMCRAGCSCEGFRAAAREAAE